MKCFIIFLALLMCANASVLADTNLKKGLAKAQYMLRQANVEKSEIAKKLKEEQLAAEAQAEELKIKEKNLASSQRKVEKLKSTIELWQAEYQKLKEALAKSRVALAQSQQESAKNAGLFETQTANFQVCEAHNSTLVKVGFELLDAYESKTASDALKQNDPFFGLKKVEIENLVQEYSHRIEDLDLLENSHLIQTLETASNP